MLWLIVTAALAAAVLLAFIAYRDRRRKTSFNPDHDPTEGFDVTRFRSDHQGFWGGG